MNVAAAAAAPYASSGTGETLNAARATAATNMHFGKVPLVLVAALLGAIVSQFGTPAVGGGGFTLSPEGMRLLFGLDAGTCAMGLCSCVMALGAGAVHTVITGTETYDRARGRDHTQGTSTPVVPHFPTTRGPFALYDVAPFVGWMWGAFPFDCFAWTRYPYAPGTVRIHSYFIDHEHFIWTNVTLYTGALLNYALYNLVLRCGDTGQEGIPNGSILCKACQRRGSGDDDDNSDSDDDADGEDGDEEDDDAPIPGAGVILHSTANAGIACSRNGDRSSLPPLRQTAFDAVVLAPRLLIILCIAAGVTFTDAIAARETVVDLINTVYDNCGDATAAALLTKCLIVLTVWLPLIPHLGGDWGGAQTALGLNSMYASNGERIVAQELITNPYFWTAHGIGDILQLVHDGMLHFRIDDTVTLLSMRRVVGGNVVLQTPPMLLRLEREYNAASVPWLPGVPQHLRQFNHCQSCGARGNLHSEGTAWRVCRRCDMR